MVKEVATAVSADKVIRATAPRIPAEMPHLTRQLTSSKEMAEAVGSDRLAINTKPSIAGRLSRSSPLPTAVIAIVRDWTKLVHISPESLYCGLLYVQNQTVHDYT